MADPATVTVCRAFRRRGSPSSSKRVPRRLTSARPMWLGHNLSETYPKPKVGRKAQGVRYERKVNQYLTERFEAFVSNLPFEYVDRTGRHFCIPDGILLQGNSAVVFEVKLSHTLRAYWELVNLYRPVVELALGCKVRIAEITQSYDPSAPIPSVNHRPFGTVSDFLESGVNEGVILWRPQ